MKKSIVSVLISVCIILMTLCGGFSTSAAEIKAGKIEIPTIDANVGDSVMVPIKIIENPGIMAVTVSITYDPSVLKYEAFYYGDVFTDYTIANHKDRSLIRLVICERRNKTTDGSIVNFKFKVLDTAKAELTKIGLEYSKGDFCNWNLDKIMPEVISGGINVAFNGKNCPHKSYGEWKEVSKPVCEEVGVSERECKLCGHKELKEISPIGHTYSDVWTIDKPATAESDGTMSRYCIRCDDYVDRVNFSLEQSEKEDIKNEMWADLSDNKVGEQLFKEQHPDEELTQNKPAENTENAEDKKPLFNTDEIINNLLPEDSDIDENTATITEIIEEAFPQFNSIIKFFTIGIVVLLMLIIF